MLRFRYAETHPVRKNSVHLVPMKIRTRRLAQTRGHHSVQQLIFRLRWRMMAKMRVAQLSGRAAALRKEHLNLQKSNCAASRMANSLKATQLLPFFSMRFIILPLKGRARANTCWWCPKLLASARPARTP